MSVMAVTKKISHCTIAHKYDYNASFADRKYREKLRDSRPGINMTKRELHQKDKVISPLIKRGQSSYQIADQIIRNWICLSAPCTPISIKDYSTTRNIDLKRKVQVSNHGNAIKHRSQTVLFLPMQDYT
ncbi:MAG: hypothetical protein ACLTUZ_09500 [Sellimonas intestinalis]|uniref:hypothetical protein n=1 Tax=Sellimonas intestinalis TaxID=1653434 RepID=UPI003993B7C1